MKIKKEITGFTITELLIASGVFSVILIIAGATIVQIGKLYYKGVVVTQTQTAARNLQEDITRPLQLASALAADGPSTTISAGSTTLPIESLCIGNKRYTYITGVQSGFNGAFDGQRIRHALWQDETASPSVCLTATPLPDLNAENPGGTNGKDMLGERMWLQNLTVEPSTIDNNLWNVNVGVLYGDRDLMNPVDGGGLPTTEAPTGCRGAVAGSQWCAQVQYNTMIFKRINDSNSS